jgi:glycosyltransferase involved in cell wall biosynthesis
MTAPVTTRAKNAKIRPLRVLCIDHEGGYGGSSRSLFYLIERMNKTRVSVDVWLRKDGPIHSMYGDIGVPTRILSELPVSNTVFRFSRNLASFAVRFGNLWQSRNLWKSLAIEIKKNYDLVHFNHTNLYPVAQRLRSLIDLPFSMHVRSAVEELYEGSSRSPVLDAFNELTSRHLARRQTAIMSRYIDWFVFISEYEQTSYRRLGGRNPGSVIRNPVSSTSPTVVDPTFPEDVRFKIACVENYRWSRGTDRLIDIAAALKRQSFEDAVFVVAGDMSLPGNIAGPLGTLGRAGGTLQDYVDQQGLSDLFLFLGHVSNPEQVIFGCDALISLTRRVGPWGRSVIEAMNLAKPIIATGPHRGLILHGVDGFYREAYNGETLAADIVTLASDRGAYEKMARRAKSRISNLCGQPDRSDELMNCWLGLVHPEFALIAPR